MTVLRVLCLFVSGVLLRRVDINDLSATVATIWEIGWLGVGGGGLIWEFLYGNI